MKTTEGTEALVALEDASPSVLFEKIPGSDVAIWPLLRWPLGRSTQEIELGTVAVATRETRAQTIRRVANRLLPGPESSWRAPRSRDVLFVVGGGTFAQSPEGRRNWLVEDFAEASDGRALVLQDNPLGRDIPRGRRPTFQPTSTFADALTRIELTSYLDRPKAAEVAFVRDVIRESFRELPFDVDEARQAGVEKSVLYRIRRIRHLDRQFGRVLDRVKPRMVIMQGASYGNRSSIIQLMKQRGILVVEPQHGWIGPYHVAYNFGAAMFTPQLRATQPDVLLTFGEFWSRNIRHPAELVAIGKPHLESMAAAARASVPKKHEVLIISSGYEREKLTALTLAIRDSLPDDWRVLLRPHPFERPQAAELYPGLVGEQRIDFDVAADVSESLASAIGVFGLASTVLYEALAFECTVSVIDSPLADLSSDVATFGERVTDDASRNRAVDRIVAAASSPGPPYPQDLLDDVWQPNATRRYAEFLRTRIGDV